MPRPPIALGLVAAILGGGLGPGPASAVSGQAAARDPYARVPNISIRVRPREVLVGHSVTVSGRLRRHQRGLRLVLQARAVGGRFTDVASTRSRRGGFYAFANQRPRLNTTYRVLSRGRPEGRSASVTVRVHMLVSLRSSARRIRPGRRVALRGEVLPAHAGRLVYLQRAGHDGHFHTVARAPLLPARPGASAFAFTVRPRSGGIYRAVVRGHSDHASGTSPSRLVLIL